MEHGKDARFLHDMNAVVSSGKKDEKRFLDAVIALQLFKIATSLNSIDSGLSRRM